MTTETIDYDSREWQHGYWVGRGELNIRDAYTGGSDASFNEGVLMGEVEYGILFTTGGVGVGTYTPTYQTVEDLEAGRVVRVNKDGQDADTAMAAAVPPVRTPRATKPERAKKLTPRPIQLDMIERALSEPTKAILQASDMGVGKTLLAAETILRAGFERVLIVGVKDTYGQWRERVEAQSDGAHTVRRMDSTKAGMAAYADFLAGEPGFYFSGSQWLTTRDYRYDLAVDAQGEPVYRVKKATGETVLDKNDEPIQEKVRVHLGVFRKMKPVDCFVLDECQVLQNRKSLAKRTMMTVKSEWRIALSGTWYGNNVSGAWSVLRWLWPALTDASYHRWIDRWCEQEEVYVPGGETKTRVVGEKVRGAIVASLPCYMRVEADPVPAPSVVYVDLTPAQRDMYAELEADLLTWLESHAGTAPLVADLPIVLRQRLRTAALGEMSFNAASEVDFADDAASSKLTALAGILKHLGEQPVLIYTDSKRFAKLTARRMRAAGLSVGEWTGDTSSKDRDQVKADFMEGRVQYLVASIAAVAVGVDGLQEVCSTVVWLSRSENEMLNGQAVRRILRPGMTEKHGDFRHIDILARDTLDTGTFSRLIQTRLSNNASMRKAA